MKKTLFILSAFALTALAQNPYYISNSTGTAYSISNAFNLVNSNFSILNTNKWPSINGTNAYTVTNATDPAWSAGLLRWDTNYLYLSVGTNSWKRVAITNW